ncbi:MAG: 1-deoxy-D-xylulose-5-phosphate synthase [Candidatus Glassbacteria bacterium RIFCSPLOWO2_12_FULL_58_11]|uniref:1-deoxy-D-xylulose-5-phosphate synthase n=1 Tax=Candidatus Glassbacteria bacterium RIFCSPLOWO2_12_FULL_58_11 TaxID=1817867 RepID=A0A1F5Z466_9BACT|nr:MAG: 1-deoxy-D-xylulose-5-phosphate synthase [Candidatus Glassbacteria bacterium RIFCSPLOWO2_12_FULL_58_11]
MKPGSKLSRIEGPADVKALANEELKQLCQEIREYLVSVVCECGGHLAPNLGIAELTVALHYIFDSPRDKIIWDVGHQCYVHKILTGRKEAFKKLRQDGGLSGFPSPEESPCDSFIAGHASTSISAAVGFATARDLAGENFKVIAVIGDGALTGGLAYEGLNNAGASGRNLLVILNDNQMSISPNVGAFSRYLNSIILDPRYNKFKKDIWDVTEKLPVGKEEVRNFARRLEESLKNLVLPGMLFEELGFKYFGPIDGHNLDELISTLNSIKDLEGPQLLHVLTKKGKGYEHAEENPTLFHGTPAFDSATGRSIPSRIPSYSRLFGDAAVELAEVNPRILAITAAMPDGTGLDKFRDTFPGRFFDVGIAEQHAVTFAAGMSKVGARPLVAIYSTFIQRAFDMTMLEVALQEQPVVFALDRAGIVGDDGPTHNGVFDLSFMSLIPNMIVSAPKDEVELRDLLYTAFLQEKAPFSIRFPRGSGVGMGRSLWFRELAIGSWEILEQGGDVAILATGSMVYPSLWASKLLAKEGLNATVVNCRFIKPMDQEILDWILDNYETVVTVEENVLCGGFGSQVGLYASGRPWTAARISHLGIPDQFLKQAKRSTVLERLGLSPAGIESFVRKAVGERLDEHSLKGKHLS